MCAGSCGPGNLHLINGLFDANRSGVPVLAIAAHIPAEEIGEAYFQETHPQGLFGESACTDHAARPNHGGSPLHPQFVAASIDRLAATDAVYGRRRHAVHLGCPLPENERDPSADRIFQRRQHGRRAAAGDRGPGPPPGRQVVSLSGDGGVAMLLGELPTLRQLQLPVKVVVFNNCALSFVELEMKAAGIVTYGTDLLDPDFAGIARSA